MLPNLLDLLPYAVALWLTVGALTVALMVHQARKQRPKQRKTVRDLLNERRNTTY